ncbi:MAG: MarR family winged helix-turn-helix transcriptional regulator [Candidatus Aminicenantia bacterium]
MNNRSNLDFKISFAIERVFNAYRTLFWDIVKETNLSLIQLQFILYLKKYPKEMRKVSNIALEFGLTKATVSDAVNSLVKKKLVRKEKDIKDRRSSTLCLTGKGEKLAKKLEIWDNPIKTILKKFPENEKENVLTFLIKFIDSLKKSGIIKVVRMCVSCSNFKKNPP